MTSRIRPLRTALIVAALCGTLVPCASLATPHVGADLDVMRRDSLRMRGERPFLLLSLRTGAGVDRLLEWVGQQLALRPRIS